MSGSIDSRRILPLLRSWRWWQYLKLKTHFISCIKSGGHAKSQQKELTVHFFSFSLIRLTWGFVFQERLNYIGPEEFVQAFVQKDPLDNDKVRISLPRGQLWNWKWNFLVCDGGYKRQKLELFCLRFYNQKGFFFHEPRLIHCRFLKPYLQAPSPYSSPLTNG